MNLKKASLDTIAGGIAGALATLPMTAAMNIQHKFLPLPLKKARPPEKLTARMARKIGLIKPLLRPKQKRWMTLASHYGYGALAGTAFPAMAQKMQLHPVVAGSIHGFFVWAGSYRGWLPAAGLWKPRLEPKSRASTMIISHLVWGAFLGLLHRPVQRKILEYQSKKMFK